MAQPQQPEIYHAMRVELRPEPPPYRPRHALLARSAVEAVADTLVKRLLIDDKGRPIVPLSAAYVSRHAKRAARLFRIPRLVGTHPDRQAPKMDFRYWLFNARDLERAAWRPSEEIVDSCALRLVETFSGSPFWAVGMRPAFHSSHRPFEYGDLVMQVADASPSPEGPITVETVADYAAKLGHGLLAAATGKESLGRAGMFANEYEFLPKSQALDLPDGRRLVAAAGAFIPRDPETS
jgi:hypothetical protein